MLMQMIWANSDTTTESKNTIEELKRTIKSSKNKAPGADGITNAMLKEFTPENHGHLLNVFNKLYAAGKVPNEWKNAVIIPILKPGKPKDKATSVESHKARC